LKLTNEVKCVFECCGGLYAAVGWCFGGFLLFILGWKIVDKWFYFEKFNVIFTVVGRCSCDVEYDQQVMALQTPFRGIPVANEDEWSCKRRSVASFPKKNRDWLLQTRTSGGIENCG